VAANDGSTGATRVGSGALMVLLPPGRLRKCFNKILPIYYRIKRVYDRVVNEAKNEKRTLAVFLGDTNTKSLLKQVDSLDLYEPAAVRAFLNTPAFEGMLGGILYEAIFEFLQKVDLLGNIVNGLPVIGKSERRSLLQYPCAIIIMACTCK
jgi:hypothetical protein